MLKIRVKDMPAEGIDFHDKISVDELDLAGKDDPKFAGPIEVKARVDKLGTSLLVLANIEGRYADQCARCLEPVEEKWKEEMTLEFPFDRSTEFIELGEDIRQELILNAPPRMLCKEDCKGICPGCGANLNLEKCKCKQ